MLKASYSTTTLTGDLHSVLARFAAKPEVSILFGNRGKIYIGYNPLKKFIFQEGDDVASYLSQLEFFLKSLREVTNQNRNLDGLDKILGFFSYEFSLSLREDLSKPEGRYLPTPLAYWVFYQDFLCLTQIQGGFYVDQVFWEAEKEIPPIEISTQEGVWKAFAPEVEASIDYATYEKNINQIRNDIKNGAYYQANFTFYLRRKKPQDAIRYLLEYYKKNPTQHYAYFNLPDMQVLSTSPETFFTRVKEKIQVLPIKGTLAKPASAQALLNSEKNSAELAMIVDLFRNDLHKICKLTSVEVQEHKAILEMQNLYHMYSEVTGQLRKNISLEEIFRALFPSGSITGCPKIRSQEAITELEDTERGVYTGSIGYLSHEEANLSVAIRTMHIHKEYLYYQVGGGIVWDSEAESEWQECQTKAQMFLHKET